MGYYTSITETDIFLDKKHFDAVYKKMCELNDYDDLKSGGSFGANNDPKEGERYNSTKWFAWMEYNYPEIYPDMKSILIALGFDLDFDIDGNLVGLGYYDKTGAEDYFLQCFAGYVNDGNYIQWKGEEDNDYYKYTFENGKMFYRKGLMSVSYDEYEPEEYVFGQMSSSDLAAAEWTKKWKAEREAQALESLKELELDNN